MSKVKSQISKVKTVSVPGELEQALGEDAEARALFDGLSASCRREYVEWVGSAKREGTRVGRAAKAVEMIRSGEKRA
jgi:uncharacterized protein YdeI (YjbR/CyaY-like superfamily)